ncbi:MAG: NAD-dependent dehydratase [Desulfuromonas sp.]|nr:MAG: NAD-dependent dehydratase [Desulfuromonas sp.]
MTLKRILVTGGAGFIGSHLCARLVAAGHHVLCLDNFFTGRRENIEQLFSSGRFELLERDVCAPINVDIDEIYNLACPASPVHYQVDPVQTTQTCVMGAIRVLEVAQKCGARVLQASTSEVYGDPLVHPQPESYCGNVSTVGPRACYDEGKRCAETLFFDYHRQYDVAIKVARIFNTYGPTMLAGDGRVVSNFIMQALKGDPLTVYGHGSQTRSFCYVDDLVEGLVRFMATDADITGPLNLGNPAEISMLQLAELIISMVGSGSVIAYRPLPEDDPVQRQPDISYASEIINWQPTEELRSGLEKTIAYFKCRY